MDPITLGMIALAVGALWLAFSPDPLARVVRVRFQGKKAQMASALDDAMDRMDAAINDADGRLVKAREALIVIKTNRRAIENQLAKARADVDKYDAASKRAATGERRELVVEALRLKADAEATVAELTPQYDALRTSEGQVESAVGTIDAERQRLVVAKRDVRRRAETAKVMLSTNELLAGIDLQGNVEHETRAEEIVADLEAKSGAMAEIGTKISADRRLKRELEALTTAPAVDIDMLADEMIAQARLDSARVNLSAGA